MEILNLSDTDLSSWSKIRSLFPSFKSHINFDTASCGAISTLATGAARRFYDEFELHGDKHWNTWLSRVEDVRKKLSEHLRCLESELAFVQNASLAINYASLAINYAEKLIAPGKEVILLDNEFPSVNYPWLHSSRRVTLLKLERRSNFLEALEAQLTEDTKCICLSHINFRTGFQVNLHELSTFCRLNDLKTVVDTTQSFGALPINLEKTPLDAMVFSTYKWACAGYGLGVLYLGGGVDRELAHPAVGWRSAENPSAFNATGLTLSYRTSSLELGHPSFPGVFALGGALELIDGIGIEKIAERIDFLTRYLRKELSATGIKFSNFGENVYCSGITMLEVSNPESFKEHLEKRGISSSARGGSLRISTHFYNTKEDVDLLVQSLIDILSLEGTSDYYSGIAANEVS